MDVEGVEASWYIHTDVWLCGPLGVLSVLEDVQRPVDALIQRAMGDGLPMLKDNDGENYGAFASSGRKRGPR